jgi:outer membrane protein assembly factor BamB
MTTAYDRRLFVSMSALGGNIVRIATNGKTLYVVANPGVLYALNAEDGTERWRSALTGVPTKGGNVALANGVVYYVDEPGLRAFNADTGRKLWLSPLSPGATIGSGVAVAGNHVVANHYGKIAAYRLPTDS